MSDLMLAVTGVNLLTRYAGETAKPEIEAMLRVIGESLNTNKFMQSEYEAIDSAIEEAFKGLRLLYSRHRESVQRHEKAMIDIGISLTQAQDKHDAIYKKYKELVEALRDIVCVFAEYEELDALEIVRQALDKHSHGNLLESAECTHCWCFHHYPCKSA